ncbi:hypothetical protein EYF80_032534 [Liparis tanakae]|uniref:Uncharacterized protein n=1 Tax=Liparis tanakae TaxID=230148 RepID=A0A4Z2GVZ9_9TELE|nr:hypothetical protein EYF80_032534 [Liparis tanakae]
MKLKRPEHQWSPASESQSCLSDIQSVCFSNSVRVSVTLPVTSLTQRRSSWGVEPRKIRDVKM